MKKIIISSYDDLKNPYFAGGGAIAVHEIAKRLVKQYHVMVITGKYPGAQDEIIDGIFYKRLGTSFLGAQLDQVTFQLALPFQVITQNYSLWLESFTPPFSTSFLPFFTKKPVIGLVHMLSGEDMKRKYKLPFDVLERIGLKTYNYFIVTSQYIQEKINTIQPKAKIALIPNGLPTIIAEKISARKKHILFIGRIEVNQKGLDLLLKAYAKIAKKAKYPLLIAGTGEKWQEKELKKSIAALQLSKKVTLVGKIAGAKKEKLLRNAACVVVPSRFETFSLVALEALAYGCPLVTFDIPGLRWIPENCRILVTSLDETALSEGIGEAIDNVEKRITLEKNGQKYASQFTWEKAAKAYDTFLKTSVKKIQ